MNKSLALAAALLAAPLLLPASAQNAPESVAPAMEMQALREKFPEYFGLGTFKGLELYVWETENGELRCGLMSGTNRRKFDEEILNLRGATVAEIRAILSTYGNHGEYLEPTPVRMPRFGTEDELSRIAQPLAPQPGILQFGVEDEFARNLRQRFFDEFSGGATPPSPEAPEPEAVPPAPTAAQALLDGFESVPRLSCEIRRDSSSPDQHDLRSLSRVFFERPDRLHSENVLPLHRRTVCDGTVLRQYVDGLPRGFSRPVSALSGEMLVNLRMLPGSNANWLEPLRDLPETALPPSPDAPRRVAYAHSNAFVVLSFDADGRWFRFERFTSPDMTDRTLTAVFSDFREIAPSVCIPARQTVTALVSGTTLRDDIRISALSTDPIPPSLFDPSAFFPNIEFTDSFDKTLAP